MGMFNVFCAVSKISKSVPSSTLYEKVCTTKLAKNDPCFVTLKLVSVT